MKKFVLNVWSKICGDPVEGLYTKQRLPRSSRKKLRWFRWFSTRPFVRDNDDMILLKNEAEVIAWLWGGDPSIKYDHIKNQHKSVMEKIKRANKGYA